MIFKENPVYKRMNSMKKIIICIEEDSSSLYILIHNL